MDVEPRPRRTWRPSAYGVVLVGAIALQPFVVFADSNRSQITQPGRLALYAACVTSISLLVLALVQHRGSAEARDRGAVVVGAVVASFLHYSVLFDPNPPGTSKTLVALLIWTLLTVLLARLAHVLGANATVRFGLVIFAVAMLLLPSVTLVAQSIGDEPGVVVRGPGEIEVPADRPNVYWIVLDAHARPDVLEAVVGYDDSEFVEGLEDRGFQVSDTSRANYPRTHMSLASTLQMDYVLEPGHDVVDAFARFTPVIAGRNETTARFEALGYRTAYGPAGYVEWSVCDDDLVDVCLPMQRPTLSTGELERALLELTPLGLVNLPTAYSTPATFVAGIEHSALADDEPFFAFQHVMTPHDPYRYDEDCAARSVPVNRRSLPGPEQHAEYANQVRCVNELVLTAVDEIVARDPYAIILVQSDHGSDFTIPWGDDLDEWQPGHFSELFGAFNAMRLPADCPVDIEGAPLVNTFRIVFACIEGTEPDLLDYRAFLDPLEDVTELTEIDVERFPG